MQPIAAWLIARPQNAIAVLAATMVLPFRTLTSGATLVLLILHSGGQRVAIYAAIAAAFVVGIGYLTGLPVTVFIATAMAIWLPIGLLAMLMRSARSLTLTLQMSVMLALIVVVALNVFLDDPVAIGGNWLDEMIAYFRELGSPDQADTLLAIRDDLAPLVTIFAVLSVWLVYVIVLLFGYALFRSLPGQSTGFGRFRDLNFGRVLALIAAGIALATMVTDAMVVQQVAIMCVATFFLQGLSVLHWLQLERGLPTVIVIVAYLMLLPLAAVLVPLLAIAGYSDTWLDLRQRFAQRGQGSE